MTLLRAIPASRLLVGLVTAAAIWAAGATATIAQSVSDIANMTGADRKERLEQGARREGALLLYTTGTQIQPLMDRFTSKYPFIKLQLYRADSAQVTKKIIEEYRAAYYECDGFELSADALLLPRTAGILQPFSSPELAAYDAAALEPGRNWAPVRESYTGIAYNTKLIPPDKAPKVWADLAKPEFKGKIAMPGSTSSTAEWVGIQVLANGQDFLRKLGQQDIRIYQITARAVANLVASGEVAILARASNAHVAADKAKGAPVAWVAPGPTAVTDTVVAITSKAKHPHAMMLMIDFLLSEEGQRMYMEVGYNSARKGLEDPDTPKQKVYFSTHSNYVEEFDHWAELWNQVFIKR